MDDRTQLGWFAKFFLASFMVIISAGLVGINAQSTYEIWTPKIDNQYSDSGFGTCLFRKQLILVDPVEAEVYLSAKDEYELFINERMVHVGQSSGSPLKFDVKDFLMPGVNVLALKVVHRDSTTAGLAAKFRVRENGESRWRSLSTDPSWNTFLGDINGWYAKELNERGWEKASKLAKVSFNVDQVQTVAANAPNSSQPIEQQFASSMPNDSQATERSLMDAPESPLPTDGPSNSSDDVDTRQDSKAKSKAKSEAEKSMAERFAIDSEFQVQQVMLDSETGSLIAMAFNEFGQLILSKEGGPLLIADITKEPGETGRVRTLCEQVSSCQGILPLNGMIFVTGDGPSGLALYRLADKDRDGLFEVDKAIVPFEGQLGEHGPHGIELGPDGMIYVTVGNASGSSTKPIKTSPYFHSYEGDLVPRMEDPGGHAVGIKAPGGTVIRTTLNGDFVETVSGGLRNVYDLAFDQHGELFLHDSDLETNIGMAWYRPTRVYHVPNGAELGWRSGWSKFPDYFADVTPPVADTGRGSPSGATLYQHFQFPARYHNTLFFADWSEGRILNVRPKQKGAGYEVDVDVFVTGRPMNVTDLSIGTDGTMFFCTGGRGTSGGVYRIAWNGVVPKELYTYSNEFERVIRMPQPNSPWGRQAIATLKKQLAENWEKTLAGIATDKRNEIGYRIRAIELLFFYGPFPSDDLVRELALDSDDNMRARIASLCGVKTHEPLNQNLDILISDKSPLVRRRAAESYFRLGELPPVEKILAMLGSKDRTESLVARRLIERAPESSYRREILETEDVTLFVNGSIATLTAAPKLDSAYRILARVTHFMEGYLSDQDFVDVLRVAQLALVRAKIDPAKIPGFAERIVAEFPAGNGQINKQLAMIMAYTGNSNAPGRINEYFEKSDNRKEDKLFVAMNLQTIGNDLDETSRFAIVDYLEKSVFHQEGSTYRNYIGTAIKRLAKSCTRQDQIQRILENGERWPNAMLEAFFSLKNGLDSDQVQLVINADRNMKDGAGTMTRKIRLGSIAMLAESKDDAAHQYLRELWQSRPDYRNEISLGLAQMPEGDNWPYLVTSVPILDDTIGVEIVKALRGVNRRPKKARQYRELIEMGFRLRESGAVEVSKLLKHWTSNEIEAVSAGVSGQNWENAINFWANWYKSEWPNELPINVEPLAKIGNYSAQRVLAHLEEFELQGNPAVGRLVFQKANCTACHRVGTEGATFGPDLSNLANRFSRREILEAIIDPSKVVSDQYQSKKILTIDGEQLFGMLIRDSSGDYLLQDTEGKTIRIADDEIEQIKDTDLSSMPEGLLDTLSLDEILHLFAFLNQGNSKSTVSQNQSFQPSTSR